MPQLAHPADGFHPAEDLFYPLALLLADRIPGTPRGPAVNGTLTSLVVLRHLRCGTHVPCFGHEVLGVISLVGSCSNRLIPGNPLRFSISTCPL